MLEQIARRFEIENRDLPETVPATSAILAHLLDREDNHLHILPRCRVAGIASPASALLVDYDAAVSLVRSRSVKRTGKNEFGRVYTASLDDMLDAIENDVMGDRVAEELERERAEYDRQCVGERFDGLA